jgi:hypothetical protein
MTITVPAGRTFYQTVDFGTVNYTYPSSHSTTQIDEILISDAWTGDGNQVAFVKRYNTWVLYTYIKNPPKINKYNLVLVYLDNANQVAYTAPSVLTLNIKT